MILIGRCPNGHVEEYPNIITGDGIASITGMTTTCRVCGDRAKIDDVNPPNPLIEFPSMHYGPPMSRWPRHLNTPESPGGTA